MKKKIGVFIPGRLSSERLPNKLILPLGESNLWDMACRKINELPERFNKYVLAYDKELIEIAKKYENIKIIIRDKETQKQEGPLKYIFKDLKKAEDTHLMFLNPCLSFLKKETIIYKLEEFEKSEKDYGTSVKSKQNWLFDKKGKSLNKINYKRLTTKEIEPFYEAAHCFHIFNKKSFFEDGYMLKEGHQLLEIPIEETIDVDTAEDYEYAKFKHKKRYVIDIDGTICTQEKNYSEAKPIKNKIEKIKKLKEQGNEIIFFTARGTKTGIDWKEITEKQLDNWKVPYDKLIFGKPYGDFYIDDKQINIKDF